MKYIPFRHVTGTTLGHQKQAQICNEGRRRVPPEDSRDMRECHLQVLWPL